MAYPIAFGGGGGNEGVSGTTAATTAFAVLVGMSILVSVVVKGPATVLSVTDTALNTYVLMGSSPTDDTVDPVGGHVYWFAANQSAANAANVVTATISAAQTNTAIAAVTVDTGPLPISLALGAIYAAEGSATGAALPLFDTPSKDSAFVAVGWKPSDLGVYMTPSHEPLFAVFGGYLNVTFASFGTLQEDVLVYFASTPGKVEIFGFVVQTDDIPAVEASHPAGNYGAAVDVSLSLDPYVLKSGMEIRYTTDGSTPNSGSTLYTTPIHISATTTLKAKAFDPLGRLTPGPLLAAVYTFTTVTLGAVTVDTVPGGDGRSLVALWPTNVAAYSFAYATDGVNTYPGAVNGFDVQGTAHEAVITGLTPSAVYQVTVESGGVVSAPVSVTTEAAPVYGEITELVIGTPVPVSGVGEGDIYHNWIDENDVTFAGQDDVAHGVGVAFDTNLRLLYYPTPADEQSAAFENVNILLNFGLATTSPRHDGYNHESLTNKQSGLIIMNGKIYLFMSGQRYGGAQYCIWPYTIMSPDGGATWNQAFDTASFDPDGSIPPERTYLWGDFERGWCTPAVLGADDGTLGQRLAANAWDGGNARIPVLRNQYFLHDDTLYLGDIPRPLLESQTSKGFMWWAGGVPPLETAHAYYNDRSNWSAYSPDRTPIIDDPGKVGGSYMCRLPGVNSWLLLTWSQTIPGNSTITNWTARVGPTPAGPFTIVATASYPVEAFYNQALLQRDVLTKPAANGTFTLKGLTTNDYNAPGKYKPCLFDLMLTAVTQIPPPPPPEGTGSGGGASTKSRKGKGNPSQRLAYSNRVAASRGGGR